MQWDRVARLRTEGQTWDQIAEHTGISASGLRGMASRRQKARRAETPPPQFSHPAPEPPSMDDLFALAKQSAKVIDQIDPIITHETITFDVDEPIGILFVSCAHLGSRFTFYEHFEQIFQQVLATPRLYWLSLGDDVEGFLPGFLDASAIAEQSIAHPLVQRRMLAYVLDKLADEGKLLAGCASQHGGDWPRKKIGEDPIKQMYLARNVPFFDGKGLLTLNIGKQTYHIALAHAFPGSSISNPNYAQRRAALYDYPQADVLVQGDRHKYACAEYSLPPMEFDAGLRQSYMQWLLQVGTAKTGPDRYSIRGWSRGVLEWPVMIFRPDRHAIAASRELPLAQLMLKGWR